MQSKMQGRNKPRATSPLVEVLNDVNDSTSAFIERWSRLQEATRISTSAFKTFNEQQLLFQPSLFRSILWSKHFEQILDRQTCKRKPSSSLSWTVRHLFRLASRSFLDVHLIRKAHCFVQHELFNATSGCCDVMTQHELEKPTRGMLPFADNAVLLV